MASHDGAFLGHSSQMHLFPDIGLGIFTNINGVEALFSAMSLITMFVGENIVFLLHCQHTISNSLCSA